MVDRIAHRGPDDAGYLISKVERAGGLARPFGAALTDRRFAADHPGLPVIDTPSGRRIFATTRT